VINASEVLTSVEITRLRRKSNVAGALLVLHAWAVVAAAMALFVLWPNPLTFIAAVMVIGGRQLGLAILMHDAAHGLLFANRRLNDVLGQWLCAYPVFTDMALYRPYHLKHHRLTQQPDDPDLVLSAPFPITRGSLKRKLLRDLSGRTAYQRRRLQLRDALGPPEWPWRKRLARFRMRLGGGVLVNVVMLIVLTALGYWWLYPLLWLLPMATWYQAITRVRNIAEHAMVPDNDDDFRAHHARQPARTAAPRPVLGELPPRAPPVPLRAVLPAAGGAAHPDGEGVRGSDGAAAGISGGAPDSRISDK
jgi:fatty acid desaturase